MKKLLLALALVFGLGLAGCNVEPEAVTSEPTTSETSEPAGESTSEDVSTSEEESTTEEESSESSEESSEEESSESSEESSESSEESTTEEEVAKTAEEVVTDINGVFNPLVGSDILAWYDEYSCFIGALNLGAAEADAEDAEAHQAELQGAAEFIAGYLPEYLTVYSATYEEDNDDYYICLFVDTVVVDLFAYVNAKGNVLVQIQVYDIAE